MNIRKIIREELEDDWSWAEEIPETINGLDFHITTLEEYGQVVNVKNLTYQ
jgi:hypothetical protein